MALEFMPGAMPKLQRLKLELKAWCQFKYVDGGLVPGMQNLTGLRHLALRMNCDAATTDVVQALEDNIRDAADAHPNRPILHQRSYLYAGGWGRCARTHPTPAPDLAAGGQELATLVDLRERSGRWEGREAITDSHGRHPVEEHWCLGREQENSPRDGYCEEQENTCLYTALRGDSKYVCDAAGKPIMFNNGFTGGGSRRGSRRARRWCACGMQRLELAGNDLSGEILGDHLASSTTRTMDTNQPCTG
nr:unnamed protein product [Digitaria exilis]